jgi:hypothetical protein
MAFKTTIEKVWNGKEVKILGKKAVGQSIFGVGLIVEGHAKALAPIDTGQLAGSITTQSRVKGTDVESPALETDKIGKPQEELEVWVGTAVMHGTWMEFGTSKTNAQPFLRPALALAEGRSLTLVERESKIVFKEFLQ